MFLRHWSLGLLPILRLSLRRHSCYCDDLMFVDLDPVTTDFLLTVFVVRNVGPSSLSRRVRLVLSPNCIVTGFLIPFCCCQTFVCQEFDLANNLVVAFAATAVDPVVVEVEKTVVAVAVVADLCSFGLDHCFSAKMVFG